MPRLFYWPTDRWVRRTGALAYHRLPGWVLLWLICSPMPLRTARRGVWRCSALSRYQCTSPGLSLFPADRHGLPGREGESGRERERTITDTQARLRLSRRSCRRRGTSKGFLTGPGAAIANSLLRFHSGALTGPRPIFARLALTVAAARLAVRPPAGEPAGARSLTIIMSTHHFR